MAVYSCRGKQQMYILWFIGMLKHSVLTEKGVQSINKASEDRGEDVISTVGEKVHQECRRRYCNPQQVAKAVKQSSGKMEETSKTYSLRSREEEFNFKSHCFFCGQLAKVDNKRKGFDISTVRTIEMKEKMLAVCRERGDQRNQFFEIRANHGDRSKGSDGTNRPSLESICFVSMS